MFVGGECRAVNEKKTLKKPLIDVIWKVRMAAQTLRLRKYRLGTSPSTCLNTVAKALGLL